MPFGAVQLSPDTFNAGWDWCSGYHDTDTSLMGFSHTHLSGTGCGDLLDFLVMAGTGLAKLTPGDRDNPDGGYRSRFSHQDEVMVPGYYSVLLKDYGIQAELTVTERAGLHRYTFPKSEQAYLILDLAHAYQWKGRESMQSATLSHPAPAMLTGGHVTSAWGKNRQAYFALEVSKKPSRIVFFQDGVEVPAPAPQLAAKSLKCVLYFETHEGEAILVRTGISGVSAEGAAKNLAAELPTWDFDKVRQNAHDAWARQLGKIQHRQRQSEIQTCFLHFPVSHVTWPVPLRRCGRHILWHGCSRPHTTRAPAQLHHIFLLGHLSRGASRIHAD